MIRQTFVLLLWGFSLLFSEQLAAFAEPPHFVFVIPSYNNEKWAEKNIQSCTSQRYPYWRLIYIDDCSNDKTTEIIETYIATHKLQDRCTLIKNSERVGALCNIYNAVMSCDPREVVVTVDGDDWLPHNRVLNVISGHYLDPRTWMTYGNFTSDPAGWNGYCSPIPERVSENNMFRSYPWVTSHLRTFYAKLFQMIKKEDLMWENNFLSMAWDLGFMYPMLEMSSRGHFQFIDQTLYVYNINNPISDHRVDASLQTRIAEHVRSLPPYEPLARLFSEEEMTKQNEEKNLIQEGVLR